MGNRCFQTPQLSHSQCVTPTHQKAQFQASGFWAKSQRLRLEQQQRGGGARGASGPRSPETLVVTSGTGECDRVPLGKGSGSTRWAEMRPHSVPRPREKCASTITHAHKNLRCTTQSTRAYTRAYSSLACSYRVSFTHSPTSVTH